ncbi:hypothetical protein EW145_g2670 [Phellinidium pouzarii]|uniref:Uncharacterized protein n=1 Tax=Phellinidium pouzarii TaxID=167371 RepID=A0A4S4LAH2_9AGAM|nr:hypothetical protein EW145_g2670 [Phellinidium pouzarii]
MDPVSVLRKKGVTNENKHDIAKLASVLASFGDFKDNRSRLQIKKHQPEQIQAIAYLMQEAAAQLSSHDQANPISGDSDATDIPNESVSENDTYEGDKTYDAQTEEHFCRNSQSVSPQPQTAHVSEEALPEIEAALTLQALSTARPAIRRMSYVRYFTDVPPLVNYENGSKDITSYQSDQRPFHVGATSAGCDIRDAAALKPLLEPKAAHSDNLFVLPKDWLLDKTLPYTSIVNILVRIDGTGSARNAWFDGAYEGEIGRILSMVRTDDLQTSSAFVRLYKDNNRDRSEEADLELNVPACFLTPLLPETCGDEVVALCLPFTEYAEVKGTRWRVRSFDVKDDDLPEYISDNPEDGEVPDVVELESEMGLMHIPRTYLAKCVSP